MEEYEPIRDAQHSKTIKLLAGPSEPRQPGDSYLSKNHTMPITAKHLLHGYNQKFQDFQFGHEKETNSTISYPLQYDNLVKPRQVYVKGCENSELYNNNTQYFQLGYNKNSMTQALLDEVRIFREASSRENVLLDGRKNEKEQLNGLMSAKSVSKKKNGSKGSK